MNHSKQKKAGIAILLVMGLVNVASAGHGNGHHKSRADNGAAEQFVINARVVDVEPLVRIVTVTVPQEVCWEEPVRQQASSHRSRTPDVLGGVIGGVIGNTMGGGRGKKIMTAAGVLLGASIGRDISYRRSQRQGSTIAYERICEIEQVSREEERTDGYRVTYEYAGREFVTHTDAEPGKYIRVHVRLEPVAYNEAVTGGTHSRLFLPDRNQFRS